MFQPFERFSQFYPGLILWCDPHSAEMENTATPPNTPYDRKNQNQPTLRPCLVVAVNEEERLIRVARFCANQPHDTRQWVPIETPPSLVWRPQAWIWVGSPATVRMILNDAKTMHPHKDTAYLTPDIAQTNYRNYCVHRQNFLNIVGSASSSQHAPHGVGASSTTQYYMQQGSISPYAQYPANANHSVRSSQVAAHANAATANYTSSNVQGYHPETFSTLVPQHVVVPTGFTETNPAAPGWWRNPETGWYWSAKEGLLPPRH
ncbi:hypothetical protein R3P38DRAFT_3023914 [Favolaschia claudopus]|uniref:Uncharacterized protein n=1 Tax=Favolaschia claudopus TaxID=2862362 RepID=A0AAW0AGG1_9AGAR